MTDTEFTEVLFQERIDTISLRMTGSVDNFEAILLANPDLHIWEPEVAMIITIPEV